MTAVAAALGLVSACTNVTYPGARRSGAEVALIEAGRNTRVVSIDGAPVNDDELRDHEVLAGEHVIKVVSGGIHGWLVGSSSIAVCVDARPGRSYAVEVHRLDDQWRAVVLDAHSDQLVESRCLRPSSPVAGVAAAPARQTGTGASAKALPAHGGPSATTSAAPRPGNGVHLALGLAGGGDDLHVMYPNGKEETLSAGDGWFMGFGGTVTPVWPGWPVWMDRSVGFGAGASFGWKVRFVGPSNGRVGIARFPLMLWLQSLVPVSDHVYLTFAAGAQKELDARFTGTGGTKVARGELGAPLGWTGEVGVYVAASRHTSLGLGLRYTHQRYEVGAISIDASNLALNLTLHANP